MYNHAPLLSLYEGTSGYHSDAAGELGQSGIYFWYFKNKVIFLTMIYFQVNQTPILS